MTRDMDFASRKSIAFRKTMGGEGCCLARPSRVDSAERVGAYVAVALPAAPTAFPVAPPSAPLPALLSV